MLSKKALSLSGQLNPKLKKHIKKKINDLQF